MRLLKHSPNDGFKLVSFDDDDAVPPYAILSHTWTHGEEVLYRELVDGTGTVKAGYEKLRFCAERAAMDNLEYFWVDTCCINKSTSDEVSMSINSMFRWYQGAAKCYVYLSDVSVPDEVDDVQAWPITWAVAFRRSRWFTRGWTLQELLAPATVEFFSKEGRRLGSKISLLEDIHTITNIPLKALRGQNLADFGVNERMKWAANRKTTLKEDKVYCLLGIFGVFLPLIYGEREENATQRLQEEIEKLEKRQNGGRPNSLPSVAKPASSRPNGASQLGPVQDRRQHLSPPPHNKADMSGKHENPRSVGSIVDYLSLIPLGNYDDFYRLMERSGKDVETLELPPKIFAKAIEHNREGRHADAQRCLHNAAVLQGCLRAKRDWRDYLTDLKDRGSDTRKRLAEDIEKLRARLPEAVDIRARPRPQDYGRSPPAKGALANSVRAFIPGDNIHPAIIGPWAKKHVGSDAEVEESSNAGRDGYIVTAGRTPTGEMLRVLIEESKKRFNSEPRHASVQSRNNSDLVTSGRYSASPVGTSSDYDRPPALYRSSSMEWSSRSRIDDRIEVPVRPKARPVPEERHGPHSTIGRSRKESRDMVVLPNVVVSSQAYSDRLRIDWAELDHGMHGACDNMISLNCFLEVSGGTQPQGRTTNLYHGHNAKFATKGIAISLDVAWEGGKATNQAFVVDMDPNCTAGVVLGRTIIEKYDLLENARRMRVPDSGELRVSAHKVHTTSPRDKTPEGRPGS